MDYPASPFADPLDQLHFSSDSSSSPYSSNSSTYQAHDSAPSPFPSSFPHSFDTPLPQPDSASQTTWAGMRWPTQPTHGQQQHDNQQYPAYHNGHTEQYHHQQYQQQTQQQHSYYPTAMYGATAVPYTAALAQQSYHPSDIPQPASLAAYNHNPYAVDPSSYLPHAVPAFVIPTASSDPATPSSFHFSDVAAPATPLPPPIKFGDVFKGATKDMVFRQSQPVRPLNHAQMRVWQQFESGDTVRSISDQMGLKPNVVMNYIIYALESYSPSPSHPIFIHWPRFSIPPELMERVSAAMLRVGGALGRMDMVKDRLDGAALDEDLRIAMIRWKMERALGSQFKQWDVYRVMTAQEAAERLTKWRRGHMVDESGGEEEDDNKEGQKDGEKEEKDGRSGEADMVVESDKAGHETADTNQPPAAPATSSHQQQQGGEKQQEKVSDIAANNTLEPSYPPPLTASELLFQLQLDGGASQRCLVGRFQREWSDIEVVLNKLIADHLAWKRGLLYCPS